MFGLEGSLQRVYHIDGIEQFVTGLDVRFGIAAVVAGSTVADIVLLAKIVEQSAPAADRRLGVCRCLHQQLTSYLLLGNGLALHEFFYLAQVLV